MNNIINKYWKKYYKFVKGNIPGRANLKSAQDYIELKALVNHRLRELNQPMLVESESNYLRHWYLRSQLTWNYSGGIKNESIRISMMGDTDFKNSFAYHPPPQEEYWEKYEYYSISDDSVSWDEYCSTYPHNYW